MSNVKTGLQNVGSYRVSGRPFLTGGEISIGSERRIEFPNVTKSIKIRKETAGGSLRVHYQTAGLSRAVFLPDDNANNVIDNFISYAIPTGLTDSFTVGFWIKAPNPPRIPGALTFWWRFTGGGQIYARIRADGSGANAAFCRNRINNADADKVISNFQDGNWHHYLVTRDNDTNTIKFFFDGVEEASSTFASNFGFTGIELPSGGPVPYFDSITHWSVALDGTEVSELYNGGDFLDPTTHSQAANLGHWYRFDETLEPADTNEIIYDRVGNINGVINVISGLTRNAEFVEGPTNWVTNNVYSNQHYIELTSDREVIDLPAKCSKVYISAVGSNQNFSLFAELTEIDSDNMYDLSGSGIDE